MGCNISCIKRKGNLKNKILNTKINKIKLNKIKLNIKLNKIKLNNMNLNNMNLNNMNKIAKDELINEDEFFNLKNRFKKINKLKYIKIGKYHYIKERKKYIKNMYKLVNECDLLSIPSSPKMSYINMYEPDGLYSYQKNKKFNTEFWYNISTLKSRVIVKREKFLEKQKFN